jgi:cellular nucleic acid-binding protein
MESIYILKCEQDKWYVGKSANVNKRFEQHVNGKGAKWTELHKPISIESTIELKSDTHEDEVTIEYMAKYGIENVRGGKYCNVEFKSYELKKIKDDISSYNFTINMIIIQNKIKNEFTNPESDLRTGRWFTKFFK